MTSFRTRTIDSYPLVSIITPSLNQGSFLEATIQSVLQQDYPNIEYIIIDGGSTDGSIEIIQNYSSKLAGWVSEADRGQAHAINKGLQRSTGTILGWLNSDDVLAPDAVGRVVARFLTHPRVDVVYGFIDRIDAEGNLLETPPSYYKLPVLTRQLAIGECIISQPGTFWRRDVSDSNGFINEEYQNILDHEYWIRLAFAGAIFDRLPLPALAKFRLYAQSKTLSLLHQSGIETLNLLDALEADPLLAEKSGLSPREARRKLKRARTLAMLKLFQAHSSQSYDAKTSFEYLKKAFALDPITSMSRCRLIAWGILNILGYHRQTFKLQPDK